MNFRCKDALLSYDGGPTGSKCINVGEWLPGPHGVCFPPEAPLVGTKGSSAGFLCHGMPTGRSGFVVVGSLEGTGSDAVVGSNGLWGGGQSAISLRSGLLPSFGLRWKGQEKHLKDSL